MINNNHYSWDWQRLMYDMSGKWKIRLAIIFVARRSKTSPGISGSASCIARSSFLWELIVHSGPKGSHEPNECSRFNLQFLCGRMVHRRGRGGREQGWQPLLWNSTSLFLWVTERESIRIQPPLLLLTCYSCHRTFIPISDTIILQALLKFTNINFTTRSNTCS